VSSELPQQEEILKLRKDLKLMSILCNHFLPCMVGRQKGK